MAFTAYFKITAGVLSTTNVMPLRLICKLQAEYSGDFNVMAKVTHTTLLTKDQLGQDTTYDLLLPIAFLKLNGIGGYWDVIYNACLSFTYRSTLLFFIFLKWQGKPFNMLLAFLCLLSFVLLFIF